MPPIPTLKDILSDPFLDLYPAYAQAIASFWAGALEATQKQCDGPPRAEHLVSYVYAYLIRWDRFEQLEMLVPALLAGTQLMKVLSLPGATAFYERFETHTLQFLTAPNIPTFMALLHLEMLHGLVNVFIYAGRVPPSARLSKLLVLLVADSRRRVSQTARDILSLLVFGEGDSLEKHGGTSDPGAHVCAYMSAQSILEILLDSGSEASSHILLQSLHETEALLSTILYTANGGPVGYSGPESDAPRDTSEAVIIRLLQLLTHRKLQQPALTTLADLTGDPKVLSFELLGLIGTVLCELPVETGNIARIVCTYRDTAFRLSEAYLDAANGPRVFEYLDHLLKYHLTVLDQLRRFHRLGAAPGLLRDALSVIITTTLTHFTISTGSQLDSLADVVRAYARIIDPVNSSSFFEAVGPALSTVPEVCFLIQEDEEPEYGLVINALAPLFDALVRGARNATSSTCHEIVVAFLRGMRLEMAMEAFPLCSVPEGQSLLRALKQAREPDFWLLALYRNCTGGSLAQMRTLLFEHILKYLAVVPIESGIRTILIQQTWEIIPEICKSPLLEDFVGFMKVAKYGGNDETVRQLELLIDALKTAFLNPAELPLAHLAARALVQLLGFTKKLLEELSQTASDLSEVDGRYVDAWPKENGRCDVFTGVHYFLEHVLANSGAFGLDSTSVQHYANIAGFLTFISRRLTTVVLAPLLDRILTLDFMNQIEEDRSSALRDLYGMYRSIISGLVQVSPSEQLRAIFSNTIAQLLKESELRPLLLDVLDAALEGCMEAGRLDPLGNNGSIPIFLELAKKFQGHTDVNICKTEYKLLRFLARTNVQDILPVVMELACAQSPATVGALKRQRGHLIADLIEGSLSLETPQVLGLINHFKQDILISISPDSAQTSARMARIISKTLHTVARVFEERDLEHLKTGEQIENLVSTLTPSNKEDSLPGFIHLMHVILIGSTEVRREALEQRMVELLEKRVDIAALNQTHPVFDDFSASLIELLLDTAVIEAVSRDEAKGVEQDQDQDQAFPYTCKVAIMKPPIIMRRVLAYLSAFSAAAGPHSLLRLAPQLIYAVLRLVCGTTTSPYRTVVHNTLYQVGLSLGYSHLQDLIGEALTRLTDEAMACLQEIGTKNQYDSSSNADLLVTLRRASGVACRSYRKISSSVLSKLRHKAPDQMVGRFTLPSYMSVGLVIPEELRSRLWTSGEDRDLDGLLDRVANGPRDKAPLDFEENDPKEIQDEDDLHQQRYSGKISSAIGVLLDENVERDRLQHKHLQKLAALQRSNGILANTVEELRRIRSRRLHAMGKSKVQHTGLEFGSERAGGDVRLGNKADPYAYLPLMSKKHITRQDWRRLEQSLELVMHKKTRAQRLAHHATLSRAELQAIQKHSGTEAIAARVRGRRKTRAGR
ncbi:hypothetical protein GMRT_22689 [Giardia muris]|uniref:Uncharacterized protein n=1 Tax=Giardia muris TaxID=5742 RepID=A0A4Z1SSV9_GIAMU|nr:hypothetical protein GMRT_22689 [Giardia muris]|eukprot:TNJ29022.1 hypothetical protein GMRT_22689 [Giardia muris]